MKLKIYKLIGDRGFSIRDESNKRIAQDVSPELAAWIVQHAAWQGVGMTEPVWGEERLTEDKEIEV